MTPSRQWRAEDNHSVACGLDLGTSGLKGVLINDVGTVVARGQAAYPTHRPAPGASEHDPQDWLNAVVDVIAQLQAVVPAQNWAGVAFSGMIPTLVCLDQNLVPVGSAITWEDSRAEEFGDELRTACGEQKLYEQTGQWVDGRYLLPMWMRLRTVESNRIDSTKFLVSAKDYVVSALTGHLATDPSTATGFGCYDLRSNSWIDSVCEAAKIKLELPQIVESRISFPHIENLDFDFTLPLGIPIVVGAADSVLGALGMGIARPGDVAYVAGTSTVILGIASDIPADDEHRYLVTPMADPGIWGIEMDLLSTGSAIRWLSEMFGYENQSTAMAAASQVDIHDAPLMLPYVSPGEQGALWNPDLTGVISGLHVGQSARHIVRGLINGIIVESRRCIEVLREKISVGSSLFVAGGSALDPWFRQQLADASQLQVVAPVDGDSDYSAIGAALLVRDCIREERNTTTVESGNPVAWEKLLTHADSLRNQIFGC